MLSTNKLKKIKSNFPVLVGDNVVSKNICNKILIYILKIQLTLQNFLNFLIASLFIKKLKIFLQKILRMDRG